MYFLLLLLAGQVMSLFNPFFDTSRILVTFKGGAFILTPPTNLRNKYVNLPAHSKPIHGQG